jgi:hypothetical protein
MLAKVFIQTYCAAPELAYGALLVFKTIRTGFPEASIFVTDNGSIHDVSRKIEDECHKIGAHFTAKPRGDFSRFYADIIENETGPVFIVDPDVVFWSSVEGWQTDAVIAGRLIPNLHRGGVTSVSRLHPSLLFIPSMERLRAEMAARYVNKMNFIGQYSAFIDGQKLFFDTLAPVYQMMPELCASFGVSELDCYDHLFYGSHFPVIGPGLDDGGMTSKHHTAAAVGDLASLKGIWRDQQTDFERQIGGATPTDPMAECIAVSAGLSDVQGIESDPEETIQSLVQGINIDPDVLEPYLLSHAFLSWKIGKRCCRPPREVFAHSTTSSILLSSSPGTIGGKNVRPD